MQGFCYALLPVLGQLLQRLIAEPAESSELADLMRIIVKIFSSCIYVDMPEALVKDPDLARLWLQVRSFHNCCQLA
jgi:hypothetical protein